LYLTNRKNPKKNFFILINPVSGAGQGVKIFQEQVEPLFHKCQIESNVQITTSVDHVKELIHEMPLNTYDCLVCVGGDGSLHVILQEIMKRKDWQEAIRLPIGLIPSGSGNGLLWSILYHNDEAFQLLNASFVVAKGMGTPLDILTVEQKDLEGNTKKKIYSFLSVEWAMIADIDVDSEIFRSLGELRFFMSSVWHFFIARKKYFGTITYLLENKQQEEQDQEISGNWKQISGKCHIMWIMNVTHASSDGFIAPEAKLNDGYVYIMMLDGNLSRRQLFHLLISLEKGTHIQQPNVQLIKTK
jgi:diacylglycerol kinase family enzyme